MNALILQRETNRLEKSIKKANRTLLEFKVAQSDWEIKNGKFKIYSSAKALMRDVLKKVR
ncbi:MAG: hypothetical protein AAB683_02195 [Patescibacteria group bacterium]